MIPLMIDLSEKSVVIFGGGEVGARKARFFLSEARVTVVSRSFSPLLSGLELRRITRDLSGSDDKELLALLEGAFLAVAATPDPLLNDRIGEACRKMGILFNNASGMPGDILIPSVMRGNHYLLAISTGGESPAVSRFLREHLEATLPDIDRMVALQDRARRLLRQRAMDAGGRKAILSGVLKDPEVWAALAKGEEDAWQIVEVKYLQ